eukprot:82724-Amphidinium_carterae.1
MASASEVELLNVTRVYSPQCLVSIYFFLLGTSWRVFGVLGTQLVREQHSLHVKIYVVYAL